MILAQREYKLFEEIRNNVLDEFKSLKKVSEEISVVDFIQSLSTCALENNYICPNIHEKYDLEII